MRSRLTHESQVILALAAALAAKDRSAIQPRHLFAALARDGQSAVSSILKRHGGVFGVDGLLAHEPPRIHGVPHLSNVAGAILEAAFETAVQRGEIVVTPHHIALALLRSNDPHIEELLARQHVDVSSLVRDLLFDLDGSDIPTDMFDEQQDPLKWSQEVRRIIRGAQYESGIFRTDYIGSEHILLSLLRDSDNPAAQFLEHFYPIPISIAGTPSAVKFVAGSAPRTMFHNLHFTVNATRLIADSQIEARREGRNFVGSEHLLFAVLANRACVAARALSRRVNLDLLERDLAAAFGTR